MGMVTVLSKTAFPGDCHRISFRKKLRCIAAERLTRVVRYVGKCGRMGVVVVIVNYSFVVFRDRVTYVWQ
jgi:hypothetical protein